MGASIPRVPTDDRAFNQYQHNVQNALQPVFNCPLINGAQVKGIALTTGVNPVNFGLNRALNGWFVVLINADATIHDSYDSQDPVQYPKDQTILLTASADCVCDIWFY